MKLVDDGNIIKVEGGNDLHLSDGDVIQVMEGDTHRLICDDPGDSVSLKDSGVAMTVIEQQEALEAWFGPVGPRGPQGVPGTSGGSIITRTAGETMGALRVAVATTNDTVVLADVNDLSHFGRVVGVTLQAVTAGDPVQIQRTDLLTGTGLNFNAGDWLYIGTGGILSVTSPLGEWWQIVGYAVAEGMIDVSLREPIKLFTEEG